MSPNKWDPLYVLLSTFSLSSLAGLAALLRSGRPLSARGVFSALLNSGLLGTAIGLAWYNYFDGRGNLMFLMAVSILAGLGGMTVLDFIVQVLKNGGIDIKISPQGKEEEKKP